MKNILLLGPPPSTKGGVTIWMKIVLDFLHNNPQENINVVHLPITRSASLTHLLPAYKRLYYSIKDYTKGMKDLVKKLKKEHYDKVHIQSALGAGIIRDWLYVKIANHYKTKAIVHYHCGTIDKHLSGKGLTHKLLLSTLKNSYKSIALDETSYNAIKSAGFNNVVKIGNSFDFSIESLENSNIKRNENEILFVGHNIREKGIFELIEACSDIENITLNIYGPQDETIHNELNILIQEKDFKGTIIFKGRQPQSEIYSAMRKATLFVLPTYTEGFPYVIVEAMANGCPIVSTPVGAIKEMLTHNGVIQGYLVEPKNMEQLKKQILYCLSHKEDIKEKAKEAKAKAFNEYSTRAVMNRFINLWNE